MTKSQILTYINCKSQVQEQTKSDSDKVTCLVEPVTYMMIQARS